jgi:hypothetical protein
MKTTRDYGKELEALGLTDLQIVTILSGWSCQSIEALLRGEASPPSHESIGQAVIACERY